MQEVMWYAQLAVTVTIFNLIRHALLVATSIIIKTNGTIVAIPVPLIAETVRVHMIQVAQIVDWSHFFFQI